MRARYARESGASGASGASAVILGGAAASFSVAAKQRHAPLFNLRPSHPRPERPQGRL